jgi:hypothetical protein
MKIIDCVQGSPEWLAARLGIPTASEFHRIVTASRGDLSKSASKYAHALVAETLLNRALEKPQGTPWAMARGSAYEPLALAQYASDTGVELRRVGFITTDDGRVGASPDALIVGTQGAVEVKCLIDENHVGMWADGPGDDYRAQVNGQMAVTELAWVDLYVWHPELPAITIRTYREEPYITKMTVALIEFLAMRDAMLAKAQASGWKAHPPVEMPATFGALRVVA